LVFQALRQCTEDIQWSDRKVRNEKYGFTDLVLPLYFSACNTVWISFHNFHCVGNKNVFFLFCNKSIFFCIILYFLLKGIQTACYGYYETRMPEDKPNQRWILGLLF
jgi:hypothetical protein